MTLCVAHVRFDPERTSLGLATAPSSVHVRVATIPCLSLGGDNEAARIHKVIAGSAATWPLVARAQQAEKLPRVGFLGVDRTSSVQIDLYRAFSSQLEKNGFREGQNIIVEYCGVSDARGPFVGATELL